MTREQTLLEQKDALQNLQQHPGWRMVVQSAERRIAQLELEMRAAKTPDELARPTFIYMTLRDFLATPDSLIKGLDVLLTNNQKK